MTSTTTDTPVQAAPPEHEYNDIVPYDPMAAKIGMWLFLFTEVMLFGALFIAYAVYLGMYGW